MFFKKYQFPLNLFLIFEKIKPIVYSSSILTSNHYICVIPKKWYKPINIILKNELFFNFSTLVDSSIIDTLKYNNLSTKMDKLFNKNRFIYYNIYYLYWIKIRLTLINSLNYSIESIDNIYLNSSWLERENFEMYNISYINKLDNRSLLLDYSRNDFPMLKDFPCEGYEEVYFDFFENKIAYINNEFIEL